MELEVTWKRTLVIWWSFLWRNLIAIVVATIMGAIFGGIIGGVMGGLGFDKKAVALVTMPVGFVIGLAISTVPLKMILGKDFGEFRLVLLKK